MTDQRDTIPVVEERLSVGKAREVTGRVKVEVNTELVEEIVEASLESEDFDVRHVPVNELVTDIPDVRVEDGVTIIPVLEEVLVVEKRIRLKEELHLTRRVTTTQHQSPVTLRKQRATISRIEGAEVQDTEANK